MKKNKKVINSDNTTEYGEFICTEHKWLPLDKQKEKANKLAKLTNHKKEK